MAATIVDDDPRIAAGYQRLERYWQSIGPSDQDLITYMINPMFQGKPRWPNTRQAYRVVRPVGSLIIASDGLSDPWIGTDNDAEQGFGCEVYIEAPQLAGAQFEGLRQSWAFSLIENFAMNVADWGGLSRQIATHGVLSTEFEMRGTLPDSKLTSDGAAGFLINLAPPGRSTRIEDMPFGPVDMVALTLISPVELEGLRMGGATARQALAMARSGPHGHASWLP
jgi:hypothetical protein